MKRLIFLVVLIPALLHADLALADKASEARAAFARARDHFKSKNYREALVELNKAYRLKPHPSLLRYIGDTYYKMNKARQAIKTYKKYLKLAPMAADKERVEAKVRQLELIVGTGDEDDDDDTKPAPPPPPPPPPTTRRPTPTRTPAKKIDLRPTGEDTEDPLKGGHRPGVTARRRGPVSTPIPGGHRGGRRDSGMGALTIAKWTSLGVGIAGLTMGIVLNRLAASDATDLEDSVLNDCPDSNKSCKGNPDMNNPQVSYSKRHHDLLQGYKAKQAGSIASFITGGVLLGTSVVLFIMDRPSSKKRRRASASPMTITPVVTGEVVGVHGELRF